MVRVPPGRDLVQTLDFLTPIVNDPFRFGQIAAANSLSDVWAMGGEPWTAMNIVCFPINTQPKEMLADIVRGGYDKVREAGAVLVGGHSVDDEEIKYGLSVTGLVEHGRHTSNAGLEPGDELLLTKPLGMGVLAVAVKAAWEGCDGFEETIWRWASHLNKGAGEVIRLMGLKAATDVTGFGLGGHAMEMARASGVEVEIRLDDLPLLDGALDLAVQGMVPVGSHANRAFCAGGLVGAGEADPVRLDLLFDAQTSGGLLLAVPGPRLDEAVRLLTERGELAARVGSVRACGAGCGRLRLA